MQRGQLMNCPGIKSKAVYFFKEVSFGSHINSESDKMDTGP